MDSQDIIESSKPMHQERIRNGSYILWISLQKFRGKICCIDSFSIIGKKTYFMLILDAATLQLP